MKYVFFLFILFLLSFSSLSQTEFLHNSNRNNITINHIKLPDGFIRVRVQSDSFANWLRQLPLLPPGSPVYDYKNRIKKTGKDTTVAAVINMNIKGKNLDQCMDILMRLRTVYLIDQNQQEKIVFPLPDGKFLSWKKWESGYRPYFKGSHFYLRKMTIADSSEKNFEYYLRTIFEYTGTQAFYHYYNTIVYDSLKIGDFIIKKNPQGHAVMIVDLAEDESGNKIALFGQGDTPACQFYILNYKKDNPWFPLNKFQKKPPLPIKKSMNWHGLRRF